eukprot:7289890-Pyramimonas_sp.AAC.2
MVRYLNAKEYHARQLTTGSHLGTRLISLCASVRSGLQYKVIKSGPAGGPSPKASTPCECHYRGTLMDGTEFDSSYRRGTPTTFAPNQVIKGVYISTFLFCLMESAIFIISFSRGTGYMAPHALPICTIPYRLPEK